MKHLDFSNQDLKGHSFKGQNLAGANFSRSDIRNCDSSKTILKDANFSNAIAGLKPEQERRLVFIAIVLAGLAGFTAAPTAGLFFISFFVKLQYTTIFIAVTLTAILILGVKKYGYIAIAGGLTIGIAIAGAGVGALAGALPGALALTFILAFGSLGAVTGAGIYAVIGNWSVLIAGCGSVVGSIIFSIITHNILAGIFSLVVAGAVEILAGIVAYSAIYGNEKLTFIRKLAIAFSSWKGTSFYKADLTRANFFYAKLGKVDLRSTSIFHTDFEGVTGFNFARLEGTQLENLSVRELCLTRNGRGKDYTDLNLNGLYLRNTNMEGAILVRTQVLGTDFTNACLTGACIQGWNFNSETQFNNVDCQRIFLKCDSRSNFYEPKPDNGDFHPGQFSKWIQEIKDTVDLIFDKGLNWKAFAFSLAQSAIDNNEENLSLKSIEDKGDGVVVAKIQVSKITSKAKIHQSIIQNYEMALQEIKSQHQLILKAKDEQIFILQKVLETSSRHIGHLIASMSHGISICGEGNQLYFVDNEGFFMSESYQSKYDQRNSNNQFVDTAQSESYPEFNQHIYAPEQKQNLAEAAAEIQQLLYQLAQTNPTTNEAVTEAIHQEIRRNPTLKARLQAAFKAGGLEALKAIFNHPLFSIPAETIKGWLEAE